MLRYLFLLLLSTLLSGALLSPVSVWGREHMIYIPGPQTATSTSWNLVCPFQGFPAVSASALSFYSGNIVLLNADFSKTPTGETVEIIFSSANNYKGGVLTVIRGFNGTTAQPIPATGYYYIDVTSKP